MVTTNQSGSVNTSNTWILDSGANHHLTSNVSQVSNLAHFTRNEGITIRDGTQLLVSSIGHSSLHANDRCFRSLNNSLHTPNAFANLLSVQKTCSDNQVLNEFHYDSFTTKDIDSRQTILQGNNNNVIYKLNGNVSDLP